MRDYINLQRYPIDQANTLAYGTLLKKVQAQLADDGCAVLKGFLTSKGVAAVCKEADENSDKAHVSEQKTNAYFGVDDPSLPTSHPIRQFFKR